jgi:hypothetical protein
MQYKILTKINYAVENLKISYLTNTGLAAASWDPKLGPPNFMGSPKKIYLALHASYFPRNNYFPFIL